MANQAFLEKVVAADASRLKLSGKDKVVSSRLTSAYFVHGLLAEHLAQLRVPEGFMVVAPPPFVIQSARTPLLELTP